MTYLALARKWRPRTFQDLCGQDILVKALTQSLTQHRLHHAYLFTGSHGIGKTSVARLLVKALNCEKGISATPCLNCQTCISIEKGSFIDLLEIDGASKTKVEETRDLLDNVQYLPSIGRFKIYLIDEVHMLSQHSFNALLKTLEEPPAHVKFLLATTDPQKLPATIISRCLQFHLKPISAELIVARLKDVLQEEGCTAEEEALNLISMAAKGSMRDALSLLEQALNCAEEKITAAIVKAMLGYTTQNYAILILQTIAQNAAAEVFLISDEIAKEGGNYAYVLETLWHEIYQLAKIKYLNQDHADAKTTFLVNQFTPETLQLYYQIALKGLDDLKFAPHPKIGFEMCLLRMLAFQPVTINPVTVLKDSAQKCEISPAYIAVNEKTHTSALCEGRGASTVSIIWQDIIAAMNLKGMTLNAAMQAELTSIDETNLILKIHSAHESLFTANVIKQLEKACSDYFNRSLKIVLNLASDMTTSSPAVLQKEKELKITQETAQILNSDPVFQNLKKTFTTPLV